MTVSCMVAAGALVIGFVFFFFFKNYPRPSSGAKVDEVVDWMHEIGIDSQHANDLNAL